MLLSPYVEWKEDLNIHKIYNNIKEAYSELQRLWQIRMSLLRLCCGQALISLWNEWADLRQKKGIKEREFSRRQKN
jgi:hypothetical protein